MQPNEYNPARTRTIAQFMADTQRERGNALTLEDWKALGLTEEQAKRNADAAARIFAQGVAA